MNIYALGSQLNPCKSIKELLQAMTGRKNCTIYTMGTFYLETDILKELELRNITLYAVGYLVRGIK